MTLNTGWLAKLICTLLLIQGVVLVAFTQDSSLGMPFITSYKAADYNGESQNWAIIQDDDGILYFANTIGILEYDGSTWRQIKPHNDGVPISYARDEKGTIYCAGTGFIGVLEVDSLGARKFRSLNHTLPDDLAISYIWNTIYHDGKVYFENDKSVIVYDGNSSTIIYTDSNVESLLLLENNIYIDTENGLFKVEGDSIDRMVWADELSDYHINFLHRVGKNALLIGTFKKGLFIHSSKGIRPVDSDLNDFFRKNLAFTSLQLPDGKIAIGTNSGGIVILNKDLSIYYRIDESGGLSSNDVKRLYLDLHNNLWAATVNGISSIEYPIKLTYFDKKNSIDGSIEEIRRYQEKLFLGTFTGTYQLIPSSQKKLLSEFPYPNFRLIERSGLSTMALYELKNKLIIGSTTGTREYDGRNLTTFDDLEARKFYPSPSRSELIIEAHRKGIDLLIYDGERLAKRIAIDALSEQIRGVAEDNSGIIWLGSFTNGVYSLALNKDFTVRELKHYTEADGLPSMRDNLVYRVGDEVYFTTYKGIYVFSEETGTFKADSTFGTKYNKEEQFIYAFYQDDDENVWLNSFRNGESTFAEKVDEGIYKTTSEPFTSARRMQIYDFFKDDSAVWLGGSDGLVRYDLTANLTPTNNEFMAKIRRVVIEEDSVIFAGHLPIAGINPLLVFKSNDVRFDNAAVYYDDDNQYQYKLEGYDNDWSQWTNEPFKIYTNLNHGEYNFFIRAKNIKGHLSLEDSITFQILTPFYFSWWFVSLGTLIFSVMLFVLIRYFTTRKLIRRVEELELIQKAQKQRERISRDLHDNVGSNLTYIISSLDYLTFKSSKDKELSEKANNLSDFTRDTMHQLRDTIWHISSEEVTLERFVKRVEEMCLRLKEISETTDCSVTIAGKVDTVLPPLPALNLFRVVQESVNNAFKHADAKNINVDIKLDSSQNLIILISDDGVGFNLDESKKDGHYGLLNLHSRMADIGARLEIRSEINKGSKVEVKLEL